MTVVKQFEGTGLADGTTITPGTVGTGDTAFSSVGLAPTYTANEILIQNVTGISYVRWNGLNLGDWAVRFYVRFTSAYPLGTAIFFYTQNTADVRIWSLSLSSSGLIQFRNASNVVVGTASGAIALDETYEFELWGADDVDAVDLRVYTSTGTLFYSRAASPYGGTTTNLGSFQFGRQSSQQFGGSVYLSHLAVANTAAAIGPVVPPAPVVANRQWDGTGLADGTTVNSATVGTGDTAFTTVGLAPTVTAGEILIPNITGTTYVKWSGLNLGDWGARFYARFTGTAPGATTQFLYATDTGGTRLWSLALNTSLGVQLRDQTNTLVGTASTPLDIDSTYEFEVWGRNDFDEVNLRIYTSTGALLYDRVKSPVGMPMTNLDGLQFGRQSTAQFGGAAYLSHFKVHNVASEVGGLAQPSRWRAVNADRSTRFINLVGIWRGGVIHGINQVSILGPIAQFRTARLWPFQQDAFSNLPLGGNAVFESTSATRTLSIRSSDTPAQLNSTTWTFKIVQAYVTDPLAEVRHPTTNQLYATIHIPVGSQPPGGTDGHVGVVQEDGFTAWELYKFKRISDVLYTSTYVNMNDLRLDGMLRGSRASGISFFHGLIRKEEVAALYIPHQLALGIPATKLKATPDASDGEVRYNSSSKAIAVWPARLQDTQILTNIYTGSIAMGAMFAIPGTIDLATLGLTAAGMAVGKALQDYGATVLVQADYITIFAEPTSDQGICALMKNDWQDILKPLLVRVTNNNSTTPGGGGTLRAPLALPMLEAGL